MVLKMSTISIILLATYTVSECTRIRQDKAKEALYAEDAQALEDRATSAVDGASGTALESPAALVQAAVSQGSIFSTAINVTGRKQVSAAPRDLSSIFSKALDYVKRAGYSIEGLMGVLKQAFIDNVGLKPAKGVGPPPMQLQIGLRTDKDMEKLLGDMKELQLIKSDALKESYLYEFEVWLNTIRRNGEQFSGPQLVTLAHAIPETVVMLMPRALYVLIVYLEQYVTGVTCKEANQILERFVNTFHQGFLLWGLAALKSNIVDGQNKIAIIAASGLLSRYAEKMLRDVGVGLPPKNNPIFGVVKGNPVILVVDESTSMDTNFTLGDDTLTRRKFCHTQLETVLEGLPNGTYFNVIRYSSSAVKIFQKTVLVSKTNIDAAMEAVSWRGGYTPGQDPVDMLQEIKMFALGYKHPFNRSTNKNAMAALQMAYATAELPSQQTDDNDNYDSSEYDDDGDDDNEDDDDDSEWGSVEDDDEDLEDEDDDEYDNEHRQLTRPPHRAQLMAKDLPQIYFLTSGQPDGGASQVLNKIHDFDNGRNIPVNSIAFIIPADPAKQFVKDLAHKTGGFFRSVQQAI